MDKTSDHKPEITDLDTIQISASESKSKTANRDWKTSDIIALLEAVEKHPRLWTLESSRQARAQDWTEILSELNIKGMVHTDLRRKWYELRADLIKSDNRGVTSKWAEYMLFLGLTRANPPKLAQDEASDASNKGKRRSISESSTSNIDVSQPIKRRCIQPALKSSNVSSSSPCVPSAALNTTDKDLPAPDPNSALCNHLLAELRVLPDIESRHLRRLLIKASYSFRDI